MIIKNRGVLVLAFTLVLCGFCNSAQAQEDWIIYQGESPLRFEVEVPAEMAVKTKVIKTELGKITTTTYAHESEQEEMNFLYVINVVDYPYGTFPFDSTALIEDFLEDAVPNITKGVQGQVVYATELEKTGDRYSKLFRIKYNDDYGVIKGKVMIYKDLFITLQVYTLKDRSLNDGIDKFLSSFRMLK